MFGLTLVFFLGYSVSLVHGQATRCLPLNDQPGCVCRYSNGSVINLIPIASRTSARFTGLRDTRRPQFTYNFNPCYTFNSGSQCASAYVCQFERNTGLTYAIANGNEQIMIDSRRQVYLQYTGIGGRNTKVYLQCDRTLTTPIASTVAEPTERNYVLNLRSCAACAGGCDCGALSNPANGYVSHTTGTILGQIATYGCNTGYNLVGDRTRTCQATGVWSGSAPTCQVPQMPIMTETQPTLPRPQGGTETQTMPQMPIMTETQPTLPRPQGGTETQTTTASGVIGTEGLSRAEKIGISAVGIIVAILGIIVTVCIAVVKKRK